MRAVEPTHPLKSFRYRCDKHFHLDDVTVDEEKAVRYGLLTTIGEEITAYIGTYHHTPRGRVLEVRKLPSKTRRILTKHGHGGQSQNRLMRLQQESVDAVIKTAQELAVAAFIKDDAALVLGLIVAGTGKKKLRVAEGLDKRLPYLGLLTINETDTPETIFAAAQALIRREEFDAEAARLAPFFDSLTHSDELAVYGEKETLAALQGRQLRTVFLCGDGDAARLKEAKEAATAASCTVHYFARDSPAGDRMHMLTGWIGGLRWFAASDPDQQLDDEKAE